MVIQIVNQNKKLLAKLNSCFKKLYDIPNLFDIVTPQ